MKGSIFLGAWVWFLGFSLLVAMEGLQAFVLGIDYMGRAFVQLPLIVLFLLACVLYGTVGLMLGGLVGIFVFVRRTVGLKIGTANLELRISAATCLVAATFFSRPHLFEDKLARYSPSGEGNAIVFGFIISLLFYLVVVALVNRVLSKKLSTDDAIDSFSAFAVALYGVVLWTRWLHDTYLGGSPLSWDRASLLGNGAILLGAFTLYVLVARFLKGLRRVCSLGAFTNPLKPLGVSFILLGVGLAALFYRNGDFPSLSLSPLPVQHPPDRPNIILITLDTTRADHLSAYGYEKWTSPNFDRLAREGVFFRQAYSTAPWTLPAHASLFAGLYPASHGAHWTESESGIDLGRLPEAVVTLAEILSEAGYATVGIIAGGGCSSDFALDQGFQEYNDLLVRFFHEVFESFGLLRWLDERVSLKGRLSALHIYLQRRADQITRLASRWVERNYRGDPFFMFLNYFDPHAPYEPPPRYLEPFKEGVLNEPGERSPLLSLYDGEIAHMDAFVGKFFLRLRKLGLYDESLIIVTGDHGEFFGEHDHWSHMHELYEEVVKVPLIIKYPSSQGRRGVVDHRVSLVDIVPTVLRELGLEVPAAVQGIDLHDTGREVVAEVYRHKHQEGGYAQREYARGLKALYRDSFKYIRDVDGASELYDLSRDPQEQSNVVHLERGLANALEDELVRWIEERNAASGETERANGAAWERLKALGYIR
jgi:arylsulfatase A-like enzyme